METVHNRSHRDKLLEAVLHLLEGPGQTPPFASFLLYLEEHWGFAFAALYLQPLMPANTALLMCPSSDRLDTTAIPADYFASYDKLSHPFGKVFSVRDKEGPGSERSPYFKNFLSPNQLTDVLTLNVRNPGSLSARLLVGIDREQQAKHNDQQHLLQQLIPYLASSLRTFTQRAYLESKSELYDELVARIGVGEIQLNADRDIVYTNTLADALLDSGHLLTRSNGKVFCHDPKNNERLQVVIDRYLGDQAVEPSEPIFLYSKSPYDVVSLLVRQLPRLQGHGTPSAATLAIFIGDHTRRATYFTELLSKLFDFSEAEARVAVSLAQGKSATATAQHLHLSPNTVRTHIAHMYDKTGLHRETALVNMLTRTLAGTWVDPDSYQE